MWCPPQAEDALSEVSFGRRRHAPEESVSGRVLSRSPWGDPRDEEARLSKQLYESLPLRLAGPAPRLWLASTAVSDEAVHRSPQRRTNRGVQGPAARLAQKSPHIDGFRDAVDLSR